MSSESDKVTGTEIVPAMDEKTYDRIANEAIKKLASKAGKMAAAKMTPEQRSERARNAAESRWFKNSPRATHAGTLELAGHSIACVVLDDGRRVLATSSFIHAIGRTGKIKQATGGDAEEGSSYCPPPFLPSDNLKPFADKHLEAPTANPGESCSDLPPFLLANNLKPFIGKHLEAAAATSLTYKSIRGTLGYGYEASLLPAVCRIYIDARRANVLNNKQKHVAEACEILLCALANVGIDALIDEATGFQYSRTRDALQKLLEQYVSRELARWERTFELDFYRHIYRLKRWDFDPDSSKRTPYVAHITVDLTYDRIHPDLLRELKLMRIEGNKPNSKLHQWLATGPNGGHPRLKQHLEGVVALMSVATSWNQFKEWVDRRYPKYNETPWLPFSENDD